jgi:SAM-dependent methyltransferase
MFEIRKNRFNNLYSGEIKSSGCGSEKVNTVYFNKILSTFIKDNNIKTILDLGCGNFESMEDIVNHHNLNYVGADISDTIVNYNKQKYTNINFINFDVVNTELTNFNQDLIIFRHIIQHLNYNDSQNAIKNIFNSKCKYVLINHQDGLKVNEDKNIKENGWDNQMYNLNIEPFNLKDKEILNLTDIDKHVIDRGQHECYSFYKIN